MSENTSPLRLNPFQSFARNFFTAVKAHIQKGYTNQVDIDLFKAVMTPNQYGRYFYPSWGGKDKNDQSKDLPNVTQDNLTLERQVYEAMVIFDMIRGKGAAEAGGEQMDRAAFAVKTFMMISDGQIGTASDEWIGVRQDQAIATEHILERISEAFGIKKTEKKVQYGNNTVVKIVGRFNMIDLLKDLNDRDNKIFYNAHELAYHCINIRNQQTHEFQIQNCDANMSSLLARNFITIIFILKNVMGRELAADFQSYYTAHIHEYYIPVTIPQPEGEENRLGTTENGEWTALAPREDGYYWLKPLEKIYKFEKHQGNPFYATTNWYYAQVTPPDNHTVTSIIDYYTVATDSKEVNAEVKKLRDELTVKFDQISQLLSDKIAAGASKADIQKISDQINALAKKGEEFRNQFNLNGLDEKIKSRIGNLKKDLGEQLDKINDKLSNLEGRVAEVEGTVKGVKEDVKGVKDKTEKLEGTVTGHSKDINQLKQQQKRRRIFRWCAAAAAVVVLLGLCAWQAEAITTWWNPDYPYDKAVEYEQQAIARLEGVDLANYDYAHDGETRSLVQKSGEMYRKAIKAYEGICVDDTVKHAERIKRLALMHMTGKGGTIDHARAATWAKKLSRNDGTGLQAMLASMSWDPEDATKILLRQQSDNQIIDDWGNLCKTIYTIYTDSAGSIPAFANLQALANNQDPYLQQMASHEVAKLFKSGYLDTNAKRNASWGAADSLQTALARQLHLPAVHTLFDTYYLEIGGGKGFNDLTVNLALMSKDLGDRELHMALLDLSKRHNSMTGEPSIPRQDSIDVANWGVDEAQANSHLRDVDVLSKNGRNDLAESSMDKSIQNYSAENVAHLSQMPQDLIYNCLKAGGTEYAMKYLGKTYPDGTPYTPQELRAITDFYDGLCCANGFNSTPVDHARADSLLLNAARQGLYPAAMAYAAHSLRDYKFPENETEILTVRTLGDKGMSIYEKPIAFQSVSVLSPGRVNTLKSLIEPIAQEGNSNAQSMMAFLCKESHDPKFLHWHQKALEHYQIGAVVYEIVARWNDMASLAPDQLQEGIRMLEVALAGDHFVHKNECKRAIETIAEMKAIFGQNALPYCTLRACNFGKGIDKEEMQAYGPFLHRLAYAYWLGNNPQCVDAYCAYAIPTMHNSNFRKSDLRHFYAESQMFFPGALTTIESAVGQPGLFAEVLQELSGQDMLGTAIQYQEPYDRTYPLPAPIHYTLQ
ncbi:MAG: hypothetical protein LIP02_09410 [Bacteroidales bacterium]|nr:hypothetical protein [Bacteroidales bacterium]